MMSVKDACVSLQDRELSNGASKPKLPKKFLVG